MKQKQPPAEKPPIVDPKTDDNPNPWVANSAKLAFWKMAIPLEVMFVDGSKKILRVPSQWKSESAKIKWWRPHHQLEKMGYLMKWEWHRKFTWRDRFAIFFGRKNLLILVGVAMRNNCGNFQPTMLGYTTKHDKAGDFMKEQQKLVMAKHLKDGAEMAK